MKKIDNPEVAAVFERYPDGIREKILLLRRLILETAATTEGVGEIEETLKWGEPSYLTPKTKSGSTVRIDWKKSKPEQYAMYFKCTANLVPAFREKYSRVFNFEGNRAIIFKLDEEIPAEALQSCIVLALTYHRNKNLDDDARWALVESLQNQG